MSNYFDNQTKWSWKNDGERVIVTTEHNHPKVHSHTMDITNVSIGEMIDNPGKVMGEAHRAVPHEYKENKPHESPNNNKVKENPKMGKREDFLERLKVDPETQAKIDQASKNHHNNNNSSKNTKNHESGRERGDDGPGREGRESGLKSGNKSNNNVSNMRADMKANSNINTAKSQLSKNGQAANHSGKTTSPTVTGNNSSGKTASTGNTGHGGSNGTSAGGHGSPGGTSGGGHGGPGGISGGGHGGH